jgi:hypothetical protein
MERTKYNPNEKITTYQLRTFASQLVGRAQLMSRMGIQYGGDRDIYKALGYPLKIEFEDFLSKYSRHDIAKAIIDRPVKSTWQGPLELIESDKSQDTVFEKEWIKLDRRLGLKTRLSRIDKLTGIGKYGVLVLGLDDVKKQEDFEKPVTTGARKLLYVKPFGEKSAKITTFVSDPKNARYGMPLIYTVEVSEVDEGAITSSTSFIKIHYTRCVHIIDDPLESEIFGTPRLEAVYNRLMDLDKVVGGDAEMFWRGARPGYEGKVDKEYQMTEEMKEDLKDQIDEYENNLRRMLINEGVELKALAQQISDPKSHFDVIVSCISAVTGIPKRILMGSERGELSSAQDSEEWKDYVQSRRDDFAAPIIVRPFVDRLVELKVLPKPSEDYTVKWNDLYSLSEKARVEIGKGRANALREYTYSPMSQAVISPDAFLEKFLGFTTEEITLIKKMRDDVISEERLSKAVLDGITAPPAPAFGGGGGQSIPKGKPIKKPVKPVV